MKTGEVRAEVGTRVLPVKNEKIMELGGNRKN